MVEEATKEPTKEDVKELETQIDNLRRERGDMLRRMQGKRIPPPKPNALVIDPQEGYGLEYVEQPAGRQWRYGDLWVYLLLRKRTTIPAKEEGGEPTVVESLTAIEMPKKLGQLPDKLYRALFWKEGEILFSLHNTLLDKLNALSTYVLIGILLFFIYLMYNSL